MTEDAKHHASMARIAAWAIFLQFLIAALVTTGAVLMDSGWSMLGALPSGYFMLKNAKELGGHLNDKWIAEGSARPVTKAAQVDSEGLRTWSWLDVKRDEELRDWAAWVDERVALMLKPYEPEPEPKSKVDEGPIPNPFTDCFECGREYGSGTHYCSTWQSLENDETYGCCADCDRIEHETYGAVSAQPVKILPVLPTGDWERIHCPDTGDHLGDVRPMSDGTFQSRQPVMEFRAEWHTLRSGENIRVPRLKDSVVRRLG